MLPEHQIIQFSWVVPSLEEAALRWYRTTGIGPFLVNRHLRIGDLKYRGLPAETDFSTAIAQAGPVQIELVQQHDTSASCYRDIVSAGAEALHHVAIITPDYEGTTERYRHRGAEIAMSGTFGDVRFCYVDTSPTLGHMTEILEDRPTIRAFFAAVQKAAQRWDRRPETLLRML